MIYEALARPLLPAGQPPALGERPELDPVQRNPDLLRYVPDQGFIGRDETLLLLDRAFDSAKVVLLHAYAGQGKTTTAVEFARWYAQTGGLGDAPLVLLTSFETHTDLTDALNQLGRHLAPLLQANGIEWHALNDPDQRRRLMLQVLQQVPVLWIWDNLEQVAGFPAGSESAWTAVQQAELAAFLKQLALDPATQARLLLTSRRDEQGWLGGIPRRIPMPRMTRPDVATLALTLGQERGLNRAELADWQPLLDYCAGNPLTLRVLIGQAIRQGLRGRGPIAQFVQAIRDGEQRIQDADAAQGRDRSLGASLDYGFRHAFTADELPVIALLHLFQGVVDVNVLAWMGEGEHALPELQGQDRDRLTGLLQRAAETGLLTPLGGTWYGIHPALPWFLRQVFGRHYDGEGGRSGAEAAQHAWVEAVGNLGNHYWWQFNGGNRGVIEPLALEESNLLHVRRLARQLGWWWPVITAMQGLQVVYQYQGRGAEWAKLVGECVPDYCTVDDGPIPGMEDHYSTVMHYRVRLAQDQDHDLARAAVLQDKVVAWVRRQAALALGLPEGAPLDAHQHNCIRNLAVSLEAIGHILREQGSTNCVAAYQETIRHCQRTGDTAEEAVAHYNLGHAYLTIPAIGDLDAAECAYRRSLDLLPNDTLERSKCIKQIAVVYYERLREAIR